MTWLMYNSRGRKISRNKGVRPINTEKEVLKKEEYETIEDEDDLDAIKQIEEFENKLGTHDSDSD